MMADINITTSIAQLPNLQVIAGAQVAHPEAQQAVAQQLAQQSFKEQMQQVQKVEKQEASDAIRDEEEHRKGSHHGGSGQRKRDAQPEHDADDQGSPSSGSPWLGHLVNRKV